MGKKEFGLHFLLRQIFRCQNFSLNSFSFLFFCSLGIIGYAPEVHQLMTHHKVSDTDDDQLYYTKLYLDENLRVRRRTFIHTFCLKMKEMFEYLKIKEVLKANILLKYFTI